MTSISPAFFMFSENISLDLLKFDYYLIKIVFLCHKDSVFMANGEPNSLSALLERIEELKAGLQALEDEIRDIVRTQGEFPVPQAGGPDIPAGDISDDAPVDISITGMDLEPVPEAIPADIQPPVQEEAVEIVEDLPEDYHAGQPGIEPADTPEPVEIPEPEDTPEQAEAEAPAEVPAAAWTPEPDLAGEPADTTEPVDIPEPVNIPEPEDIPEPADIPVTIDIPETAAAAEPPRKKRGPAPRKALIDTAKADTAVMDVMAEQQAWRTDRPGSKVKNVISAISLNDRLLLINVLFKEDPVLFQETIAAFNGMDSLEEAVAYVHDRFPDWDLNSEPVYRLMMAVRRKLG